MSKKAFFIISLFFTIFLARMFSAVNFELGFNFSSITALALFSGAVFNRRIFAIVSIISCVWLSDLIIDYFYFGHWNLFYTGFYWQYGGYALFVFIGGHLLKNYKLIKTIVLSLSCSIIFFIISNFGVWFSTDLYPKTLQGLFICYLAGLPFFKHSMLSDLFFVMIIFYGWHFCFSHGFKATLIHPGSRKSNCL